MTTVREVDEFVIHKDATLGDALTLMDRHGHEIVVLVDGERRLVGVLTDGDARRGILTGATTASPVAPLANHSPTVVPDGTGRAHVLDVMRATHLEQIPVVDGHGVVVGLHTLAEVVGLASRPNVAVIMAGGRGVRLGELTRHTPKPLVPIAGRPIIEWVLLNLVSGGITDVHVSVNYLADQIEDRLGDGSTLGARIHYLREDPALPLGTAGALALLAELGTPTHPVIVTNADLMVQYDVGELLDVHTKAESAVTVGTRRYEHQVPFGVIERGDRGEVAGLVEKPVIDVEVNAGIYALSPDVLEYVPRGRPSTMPELVETCLQRGRKVRAWAIESDWIDVGTPRDLARAKGQW